jgi:hypothetical protein
LVAVRESVSVQVFGRRRRKTFHALMRPAAGSMRPTDPGGIRPWIKVHNPASIAVQRERSERWNK